MLTEVLTGGLDWLQDPQQKTVSELMTSLQNHKDMEILAFRIIFHVPCLAPPSCSQPSHN